MPGKTVLGRDIIMELTEIGYKCIYAEWEPRTVVYLENSLGDVLKVTIEDGKNE